VVLPADDDGRDRIVAGHRRYAAGLEAGVTDVPAVVRHLSPIEAVEAMLSENVSRSDLTVAAPVRRSARSNASCPWTRPDAGEAVPPDRPLPGVGAVTDGGHDPSGAVEGRAGHR
jgi:ParB/RepB/Spo0J family partition protein